MAILRHAFLIVAFFECQISGGLKGGEEVCSIKLYISSTHSSVNSTSVVLLICLEHP